MEKYIGAVAIMGMTEKLKEGFSVSNIVQSLIISAIVVTASLYVQTQIMDVQVRQLTLNLSGMETRLGEKIGEVSARVAHIETDFYRPVTERRSNR